ncbi:392R [Invertebrate iridescent virus Kaz2018]|uniref:392R n=1 Tax=Invertebrate iridescent virus 6 TaxID=176652 RepID=Q91FD2_IIV6|nr:392R [Invertebrate iridescent virus 6]AAK82252.1 392R [Invertebrate iridescent virus 6]QNH08802.1 392R [Invertebrate iridescent virus Kaz2018]
MPLKFNFFFNFFLFFFYFFNFFWTYSLTPVPNGFLEYLSYILIGLLIGLLLFEDGGDKEDNEAVGDEGCIFSLINLFITGGSLSKSILETTF